MPHHRECPFKDQYQTLKLAERLAEHGRLKALTYNGFRPARLFNKSRLIRLGSMVVMGGL
jgi:hypothetical protein